MINNLPTIYEVVTGAPKKPSKEKTSNSSSKRKTSSRMVSSLSLFVLPLTYMQIPNNNSLSRVSPRLR